MNAATTRSGLSWSARLLIGLTLILAGAAAATWGLAHYRPAAQLLGVTPKPATPFVPRQAAVTVVPVPKAAPVTDGQLASLEARLARVENATRRAEGSAGRADALVVAFAARRAIDRGVQLGYLEPLLVERFGAQHPQAVAAIVTGSRTPVRLQELISEYEALAPQLRAAGPEESWWAGFQRELGSLIEIRRANKPSTKPDARYQRAAARLSTGDVDAALAETMRLPGASQASPWVAKARRYVTVHRALDEVESSALLVGASGAR